MIIVLTIIFVMTTLGGIALLSTLGNLRMSAKYADWTRDYYELDTQAEDRLRELDALLAAAEGYAYAYMRDGGYREAENTPVITGNPATELTPEAQDFIYSSWYGDVYTQSLTDTEDSDGDAAAAADDTGGGDTAAGNGGGRIVDEDRYNSLFIHFNEEFFQRLYYYFAYRLLTEEAGVGPYDVELSPMMKGFAGMLEDYGADTDGMRVAIDVILTRDNINAREYADGAPTSAKHIELGVYVTAPVYGYETSNEDVPFKANPIWTGALTARGAVHFADGGTSVTGVVNAPVSVTRVTNAPVSVTRVTNAPVSVTRVYGDVSAAGYNEYTPEQNSPAEAADGVFGVASAGASVEIYGNVYTSGDLHVTADGGDITVRRYTEGFGARYRAGVFGNTLFFDPSNLPAPVQRFTQPEGGVWDRDFIPFVYRDHLGGNVYCNNLAIEEGVDGGAITVENGPAPAGNPGMTGVVWTRDDVQNDGVNSRITIAGTLIGLSSDIGFGDHTSSSAVINTYYESSLIELYGDIIMPGTAFMRFDGVNDMNEEDTYFETGESVSAYNPLILRAYMEKPVHAPASLYYYDRYALDTEFGATNVFLVHYDAIADTAHHVAAILAGDIPDSGIVTGGDIEGYARGLIVARDRAGNRRMFGAPGAGALEGYSEMVNYSQNYVAYSEISESLDVAFASKTESLGTAGYLFGDLVKPTAVLDPGGQPYAELSGALTYLAGDGVVELSGEQSGIIYCAAANDSEIPKLTLRGDGSFRGTIISEGDIIVEGNPTIRYDEDLVAKLILYYPEIRDFFSPGEMGETSFVRVVRVAQAARKLKSERYRVSEWTQRQD